jgi:hypothetical protein
VVNIACHTRSSSLVFFRSSQNDASKAFSL